MNSLHTILFFIIIIICLSFSYYVLNKQYNGLSETFKTNDVSRAMDNANQSLSNFIKSNPFDLMNGMTPDMKQLNNYASMLQDPRLADDVSMYVKIVIQTLQQPNISLEAKQLFLKLIQAIQENKVSDDVMKIIQHITEVMQKENIPTEIKQLEH